MCKVIEDLVKEEREEAMQEGIQKTTKETALRMLATGEFTLEQIARALGLSLEEVKKFQAAQET